MLKRLIFPVLLMLAWSVPGLAQEKEPEIVFKKVAVLPFAVVSKTPMEGLGGKVRQELQDRLKTDGFTLIPQGDLDRELAKIKEPLTDALAQDVGRKAGADVVVLGQLIIVGEALALEAKLLDLTGRPPTTPIKLQGTGMKSLAGLSHQLAQDTSNRILGKERINRIIIKGNRRIEKDAILGVMQSREGEIISPARLRDDIKAVYKMGYFTDVKVDVSDTPEGRVLTLLVQEKPAIKQIIVKGQHAIKRDKVLEVTDLKPFMVASETAIKENINKIVNLYRDKGFYEAKVNYRFEPVSKNEVNLVLLIDEGGKLQVKDIDFTGNNSVKAKELRGVMETKEKSMISFITGSGKLAKDTLERDLEKIAAYYFNHGFIKAKVGEPKVDIKGKYIKITIPVEEGPQYKVGQIDFQGELLDDKAKLKSLIELPKEKVYSREVVQQDLTTLSDFYADSGYANADITPLVKENNQELTVDVTFDFHKGRKVYFDRIDIAGNVRTRDKVIRRELRVYEQEMFSATKLKESIKNLRRLEYFEDVNFSTNPGSAPDRMNLKITVKERPTGTFGLGAGYSTQDRLVGMVEVSQNNLFGRGQQLKVQGIIGAISHRFRLSFTEPYLFDRPLSSGFDVFNWARDYAEYTRNSIGGDLRLSHPLVWKYTRLFGMYRFENVKLSGLMPNSSPVLQEAALIHNTSAVSTSFRRDSRDATFNPTTGSDNSFNVEMAGLGGDTAFMRYIAESGWYWPLWWKTVGVLHGRIGFMQKLPWGALPAYEKFYLGGIDSIRGFKFADISPRDPVTNERIGGDKFVQLNAEYRFPLIKKLGVMGTLFFDAGNVYGSGQSYFSSIRTAVGTGFRWFSPMGPLRVEWGWNIAPKSWEKHSSWEFTVGSQF
ncbi:MAG: outer membrane protein assembly factor BamA [Desulfobaccales bacterium]